MTTLNKNEPSEQLYGIEKTDPRELFLTAIANEDADQLHALILLYYGINIPRKVVTPGHNAPFDFVFDYLTGKFRSAVVLANRSGGKTLNFGLLDSVMAYISPDTEIATVGAIQSQARKAYEYFKQFSDRFPFRSNIIRFKESKTDCKNRSVVQVLTGTMSGVNSPHPQILFLDEIDLMSWAILQQAFSMPQSRGGVTSRMVLTSTRKFPAGAMQTIMDSAKTRGMASYKWNIWEVVKALPMDNPELLQRIYDTFGEDLPENIGEADGYYDWEDLITKYNVLDRETWEVEWLCSRPGTEGLVYGASYSDENNYIGDWSPVKNGVLRPGGYYLLEDFGFGEGHPDVLLFGYIPPEWDRLILFDELYMTGYTDEDVWSTLLEKLKEHGLTLRNIRGWACDYHGLTEIAFRKRRGAPIMAKHEESERYDVWNGVKMVQKLFQSGRILVGAKCKDFRMEILSLKKKKNLDGTYSNVIIKSMDHGPDALRYLVVLLFDALIKGIFVPPKSKEKAPVRRETTRQSPPLPVRDDKSKPITAGMMDMKF